MLWTQYESVIFTRGNMGDKIAGFNLINTIVDKEWDLLYNNTKEKLKELQRDGYAITLFLNKKSCSEEFKEKIDKLERVLGISLNVYISLENDKYSKPMTGLWELCVGKMPATQVTGFICGDCGGRKYKRKDEDYNSNDLYFAHNIRLPYVYPEDLFQQPKRSFTVKNYPFIPSPMPTSFPWELFKKETKNKRHVVIIQGCITFLKNILVDMVYTSNYNYNYYIATTIEELHMGIEENRNIIYSHGLTKINTLDEIIPHKYTKVVFYMNITKPHALHLNEYNVQRGNKRDPLWKYDKYYDEIERLQGEQIDTTYQISVGHLMNDIGKEYYYRYDIKRKL